MSLYVNSACNLSCGECIMSHLMKSDLKYHMSLDELEKLIHFSELSGYRFNFVLTGGDPLIWKNLEPGLAMLRKSFVAKSITMFTNAMFYRRLTPLAADCLDHIRISHYDGNSEHMDIVLKMFPRKASAVERMEFWENPKAPVPGYSPVVCLNPEHLYYNYQVYACPHSASIAKHNGSKVRTSNPLGINFLEGIQDIKRGHHDEICSMCISNQSVRDQVLKIRNENKKRS